MRYVSKNRIEWFANCINQYLLTKKRKDIKYLNWENLKKKKGGGDSGNKFLKKLGQEQVEAGKLNGITKKQLE